MKEDKKTLVNVKSSGVISGHQGSSGVISGTHLIGLSGVEEDAFGQTVPIVDDHRRETLRADQDDFVNGGHQWPQWPSG